MTWCSLYPREWTMPPFGGIVQGRVYLWAGRFGYEGYGGHGIDGLCPGETEKLPVFKDLVLVVCCDEIGSRHGAEYLTENDPGNGKSRLGFKRRRLRLENGELGGDPHRLWGKRPPAGSIGRRRKRACLYGQNPCELLVEGLSALKAVKRPIRVSLNGNPVGEFRVGRPWRN